MPAAAPPRHLRTRPRRAWVAPFLALLLAVPALVPAGALPASAASGRVTITSGVSSTTVTRGTKVVVRATYRQGRTPVTCCSLRLQQRTTGAWRTVATLRPSSTGKVSRKVAPAATTSYRFVTASGRTVSAVRTVTVRAASAASTKVTLRSAASTTRVRLGGTVRLAVRYRQGKAPVTCCSVRLQQRTTGAWSTVRTVRPSSEGTARVTLAPARTTQYRWTTTSGRTVSTVRTVAVTSPAPTPSAPPDDHVPASFSVEGKGFGHGLGMSQFGAYEMAREGRSAAQILEHYFTGTTVAERPLPEVVAVQVVAKADPDTLTFAIDDGTWRIRTAKGTTAREDIPAATTGTLRILDGRPVVDVGGTTYPAPSERGATLRLHWSGTSYYRTGSTPAVARILRTSGAPATHGLYRHGRLTVTVVDGHLNVVNELRFADEYLDGLGEMPSSWPRAALEAQAVAARSYAYAKVSAPRKASCNCHVVDSTADQFFTGWTKESEGPDAVWGKRWTAAVDAVTRGGSGLVVLHDGAVATTYYSSSTGGRTASSEEVWTERVPYLRSVDDPWSQAAPGNLVSSNRVWTTTLSQASAASIFGLEDVVRVDVTARWTSGQAKTLRATSSDGRTAERTEKGDRFRTLLGLPGAWIDRVTPKP